MKEIGGNGLKISGGRKERPGLFKTQGNELSAVQLMKCHRGAREGGLNVFIVTIFKGLAVRSFFSHIELK